MSIKTFACKDTQALFRGTRIRRWVNIERAALRKLEQLDWSSVLQDLRVPPGNQLEALRGDRKGQYSIRINDQWRVCFRWHSGHALDVEIVDYH
ncbi:MAG: type II toxin-antitoxin system RelE/ParE family toxin [Nitrosomonadaceae bacterium]|jgi:proteic killer suppression protein|nr:type II toxin-antitoxin system RelE/ParE family toxin [Nitrosomonadaceae bacterium]